MNNCISNSEIITRYILDRNKFSPNKGRIKPNSFLPPISLQTSVYRTDDMTDAEIWTIGTEYVGNPQGKKVLARADILADSVFNAGLDIEPDPTPHPRHANLVGWPDSKEDRMRIAQELAANSSLSLAPQVL